MDLIDIDRRIDLTEKDLLVIRMKIVSGVQRSCVSGVVVSDVDLTHFTSNSFCQRWIEKKSLLRIQRREGEEVTHGDYYVCTQRRRFDSL